MCFFQIYLESAMITRLMSLISCSFPMGFFDRESESLSVFWDFINGFSLRGIGEDKMCWTPTKSRGFKVSSYH